MKSIGFPEDLLHLVTAHGMRTGGACDLRDSGTDIEVILTQGRWTGRGFKSYLRSSAETSASVLLLSSESNFAIPMADLKVGDGSLADKYNMALNSIHRYQSPVSSQDSDSVISDPTLSQTTLSSFTFQSSFDSEEKSDGCIRIDKSQQGGSEIRFGTTEISEPQLKRQKVGVQTSTSFSEPNDVRSEVSSTSLVSVSAVTDPSRLTMSVSSPSVINVGLRSSRSRAPIPTRLHGCDARY
jgi:hypothetical protein